MRLCDIPEVVAIKEATGNLARAVDLVEKCGDRITLLSGDDFTVLPFIACGGKGVISVSSQRGAADDGGPGGRGPRRASWRRRASIQVRLNALHRLLFVESNPIPVKWALHLMGVFGPEIRLPLTPHDRAATRRS